MAELSPNRLVVEGGIADPKKRFAASAVVQPIYDVSSVRLEEEIAQPRYGENARAIRNQ